MISLANLVLFYILLALWLHREVVVVLVGDLELRLVRTCGVDVDAALSSSSSSSIGCGSGSRKICGCL